MKKLESNMYHLREGYITTPKYPLAVLLGYRIEGVKYSYTYNPNSYFLILHIFY